MALKSRNAACMLRSYQRSPVAAQFRHASDDVAPAKSPAGRAALALLTQKRELLEQLQKPAHYTEVDSLLGASIGGHMRHSLAQFQALFGATTAAEFVAPGPTGPTEVLGPLVQYDVRERGTAIETDAAAALDEVQHLASKVQAMNNLAAAVRPAFMLDASGKEHTFSSNAERELFFCAHHATHHMASIALILKRLGGYDSQLLAAVGRAPSTLFDDASRGSKDAATA